MRHLRITVDGVAYDVTVEELDAEADTQPAAASAPPVPRAPTAPRPASAAPAASSPAVSPAPAAGGGATDAGTVVSPLAGTVISVEVTLGQTVAAGAPLLTLEAMKMNTPINAPHAGTVAALSVAPGATVTEGQQLLVIAPA